MKRENLNKYPNFYSATILLISGYDVVNFLEFDNNPTLYLRNPNAKNKLIAIPLYMAQTSQGAKEFAEIAINELQRYIQSENCKYSEFTKDQLQVLVNTAKENLSQNDFGKAFNYTVERTLQIINTKKDYALEDSRTSAMASLTSSLHEFSKEYNNEEEKIDTFAVQLIMQSFDGTLKGYNISQLTQQNDEAVLTKAN